MKEKEKIRWGIIGLGYIAHQFCTDLMLVQGAVLAAVASRNEEKAKKFSEKFYCQKWYSSYDALITDAEIDIIYIATPHYSHVDLAIRALQNNKHVLCEKPIALHYGDAFKMISTARENNKFFMEAFWTRFNPSLMEVFSRIQAGEIGDIKYINADFAFKADNLGAAEDRKTDMKLGGGALLDIGVYPLFLSYLLLGIPKEIVAKSIFHPSGADLQTSMILQYDSAQAILHASFVNESSMQAMINGTLGQINLNAQWFQAQSYSLVKDKSIQDISLPTKGRGFTYEIEECHQCIKQNKIESDLWSHQNSIDLIKIVERVKKEIGLEYPILENKN